MIYGWCLSSPSPERAPVFWLNRAHKEDLCWKAAAEKRQQTKIEAETGWTKRKQTEAEGQQLKRVKKTETEAKTGWEQTDKQK